MTLLRSTLLLTAVLAGCARAGQAPAPAVAELQSVWALYVEPVRSSVDAEFATSEVRRVLQSERRFVLVNSPEQAHAIVRVTIAFQQHDPNQGDPALQGEIIRAGSFQGYQPPAGTIALVTPEGEHRVIWSRAYVAQRSRHRQTNPAPQTVIARVVAQLGGQMLRVAGPGPLTPEALP